jgi:hypothetical protein
MEAVEADLITLGLQVMVAMEPFLEEAAAAAVAPPTETLPALVVPVLTAG